LTTTELIAAIAEIDPADAPAILAAVAAKLSQVRPAPAQPASNRNGADDDAITVEDAARMLCRSPKWISRHRAQLPFLRKLGPRSYVCSRAALIKWRERGQRA
jgi:hypothetical protein